LLRKLTLFLLSNLIPFSKIMWIHKSHALILPTTHVQVLELLLWLNIRAIDLMIINNTMNCYIYGPFKKRQFHLVLEKEKKWTANIRSVFISDVIEIYLRNTYNYCKFTTDSCTWWDVLVTALMYLWHACWFSQGTPVTSTYRTDHHYITEIWNWKWCETLITLTLPVVGSIIHQFST
jgi:hypothetical protein